MMKHIPNVEIKLPKKKNNKTTQRRVCVYTLRDIRFLFKLTVLPHSLALCCRIRLSSVTYEQASERACGGLREKKQRYPYYVRVLTHKYNMQLCCVSNLKPVERTDLFCSLARVRTHTHTQAASTRGL